MQNGDLRPLGLGELLDRAITLSVRRFSILAASVAPAYAAFAAVRWLLIGDIAMRASSDQPTGDEWLRGLLDLALAIPVAALRATAFTRPWRSPLAALVLVLVAGGIVLVSVSLVQLIPAGAVRNAVWFALSTFESIVTEILTVAFLVVYDVDIAVRREGLDLSFALGAPRPTSS